MKKKILTLFMVAFLIISFAGCTGENKEDTGTEESGSQIAEGVELSNKDMGEFKTVDLNGEAVDKSVLANHEYTVVDVWGTFCGPCIQAMPRLEKMNEELSKQDIGVMGIVIDAQGEHESAGQIMGEAKKIVSDVDGKIPSYAPPEDFLSGIGQEITGVPSQFLINSKGEVVSPLYLGGAPLETWVDIVNSLK